MLDIYLIYFLMETQNPLNEEFLSKYSYSI